MSVIRAEVLLSQMRSWLKQFAQCEETRDYTRNWQAGTAQVLLPKGNLRLTTMLTQVTLFLGRGVSLVRVIDAFKLEYKSNRKEALKPQKKCSSAANV